MKMPSPASPTILPIGWTNRPSPWFARSSSTSFWQEGCTAISKPPLVCGSAKNWSCLSPSKFCGSQFYGRRLLRDCEPYHPAKKTVKDKTQLRNDMGYNVKINFSQSPLPSAISVRWPSKPKPVTSVMACTPVTAPISGLCCWVASSDVPLCPCALLWGCLFSAVVRMPTPKGFVRYKRSPSWAALLVLNSPRLPVR